MSDTLTNALAQAGRSSSVLSGIANPAVVNPLAGYGSAISAVQGIQDLQQRQQTLSQNQQTQQLQKLNYTAGTLADLLNQPGQITSDQVRGAAMQHVGDGITDENTVNQVLSTMPQNTADNPNAVRGWVRQLQIANLGHQQQIMAGFNPATYNVGDRQFTVNQPTMPGSGGAGVPSVNAPMGLTPGEATQIDRIDLGNGQTIQIPHDQATILLRNNPAFKLISGGGGGAGSGGGAANNPLNIRFIGQPGATNNGGFAAFSTPEAGQAATDALFGKYADGGINTLSGLISKWAPPSENDTAGYIARVAKATGLDPNTPIDLKDPAVARKIQQAMAVVEGNKNASVAPLASTTPPTPPAPVPPHPGSPFGATAFSQPSTALPAPASQATAPNTTAAVPPVPTPQMAAAAAVARQTGRPAPIAGTDGLFANPDGSVGSGPRAGGISGKRADIPNALLAGVQTAQTTMPPANALVAGPGAPTVATPAPAVNAVPPPNAFGSAAFGSTPASAPAPIVPPTQPAQPAARPTAPTLGMSAPPGYVETLKNDIDTRTQASLATGDQRKTLQAGESALDALHLAQGYTGPGTGVSARMYAFLQAHDPTGALPQGDMSDTAWRQVMAKNLIRFAASAGLRSNTDKSLEEQLHGTANVDDILPTANEHVLVQDIGNARQRMAQTMLMPPPSGNGDVINHFRNYTGDTDPRGFAIDLMSQPERDAIEKELKRPGNEKALARFTRAVHDGLATGLVRQP